MIYARFSSYSLQRQLGQREIIGRIRREILRQLDSYRDLVPQLSSNSAISKRRYRGLNRNLSPCVTA